MAEISLRERAYRLLCDAPQPLTVAGIADRLGEDRRPVGETLRKLSQRDLVKLDHRYWRALRPDVPVRFGPRAGGPREFKPKVAPMVGITEGDLDWMAYWRLPARERYQLPIPPPMELSC